MLFLLVIGNTIGFPLSFYHSIINLILTYTHNGRRIGYEHKPITNSCTHERRPIHIKIAVSATGNKMDSQMDQRFGRAASFLIVETKNLDYEAIDNSAAAASGGAGISAAQLVADKGAEAVVTGNVGPNAMNVLKAANIEIYKGSAASVKENVELFKKGALEKISTTVPVHFGMGGN